MKSALSLVAAAGLLAAVSAGAQSSSSTSDEAAKPSSAAGNPVTLGGTPSLATKVNIGTPPNTGNAVGPGIDAPGPVNEGSSSAIQTSGPDSTAPSSASIGSTSGTAGR